MERSYCRAQRRSGDCSREAQGQHRGAAVRHRCQPRVQAAQSRGSRPAAKPSGSPSQRGGRCRTQQGWQGAGVGLAVLGVEGGRAEGGGSGHAGQRARQLQGRVERASEAPSKQGREKGRVKERWQRRGGPGQSEVMHPRSAIRTHSGKPALLCTRCAAGKAATTAGSRAEQRRTCSTTGRAARGRNAASRAGPGPPCCFLGPGRVAAVSA